MAKIIREPLCICDRCGKEITGLGVKDSAWVEMYIHFNDSKGYSKDTLKAELDICYDCMASMGIEPKVSDKEVVKQKDIIEKNKVPLFEGFKQKLIKIIFLEK